MLRASWTSLWHGFKPFPTQIFGRTSRYSGKSSSSGRFVKELEAKVAKLQAEIEERDARNR